MSGLTTKELAIRLLGIYDVHAYERAKVFHMRLGDELARGFAEAVGGRVGGKGEPDVITDKGVFEFCASANTKNAAGSLVDGLRGQRVQATGCPRTGFMSGEEFLELHSVPGEFADDIRLSASIRAIAFVANEQKRLPI